MPTKESEQTESITANVPSKGPVTLSGLADEMDAVGERGNVISRILAHHVRNRRELDKVCGRLGALEEENADLKSRLATLEGEGIQRGARGVEERPSEESPSEKRKQPQSGYEGPERRKPRSSFIFRYRGPERRKSQETQS
jgi:hypothetical protein